MKLLAFVALLLPSLLLAQSPPVVMPPSPRQVMRGGEGPSTTLPDNYQITLIITDKDGQPTEVSVVAASTRFNVSLGEQGLSLQGLLTIEESGSAVVEYALSWTAAAPAANNNMQYQQSTMSGSVRLKLAEEVQIIRAGPRVARLSIKKLEASKPK